MGSRILGASYSVPSRRKPAERSSRLLRKDAGWLQRLLGLAVTLASQLRSFCICTLPLKQLLRLEAEHLTLLDWEEDRGPRLAATLLEG